ncbi:SET protein [Venustampulla echinocandica]|uniref:SET protein n=1 Tax=Venustampulla echinocandica TaxID=2656787 RepID=A0A370TKL8_9HELO|nr:SET protein [Venustampulla echinocandica]RDL36070.1 SET protein [Venustampulla echinocandica]
MEAHRKFSEWAVSQGVEINGIAAHRFPGRGLGIIAQRNFEAGETIVVVPISALRTAQTVPKRISRAIGKITVHGLLAAELTLDTTLDHALWSDVLPTREDIAETMPLMWDSSLQSLLPEASKVTVSKLKSKLSLDWAAVSKAFPDISYDDYLYHWLIINTRTFYFLIPKAKKRPPHLDCLAQSPFADYFNHAAHGCKVAFDDTGYEISTDRPYEKGSEIYISYGNHSNDLLLAEYGFILEENHWDEITLDSYIVPMLSEKQKLHLEEAGFLGKYILDKEVVCHRTQVVLRIFCLPIRRWKRFVDGLDDGDADQAVVDISLLSILQQYENDATKMLASLPNINSGLPSQREILSRRWKQIHNLLQATIKRMQK